MRHGLEKGAGAIPIRGKGGGHEKLRGKGEGDIGD